MMRYLQCLLIGLTIPTTVIPAYAVLSEKIVNITYYTPDLGTPYTVVGAYAFTAVAPTTFVGVINQFNIGINDKNILVTFNGPFSWTCCRAYNGWVLTVQDSTPITSVKINPATNVSGFTVSFDASHIYVNWPGMQGNSSSVLSLDIEGSGLSAPTNLRANQLGLSGTQIGLSWDYGSDPIDGFIIERKKPLAAEWEVLPVTLLADRRSWVDNTVASFETYSYQLKAFTASEVSEPSNEATCFQLKLFTSANGTAMEASFQPGQSLFDLAKQFGFNHFNWISIVTLVPSGIQASPRPFLDPPIGGYPDRPADLFPYYWDDVLGFDVRYFIGAYTQGNTVRFHDLPGYPNGTALDHMEFKTMLVGVQGPVGTSSFQSKALNSFSWNSNHIGEWGGVYNYRFWNVEPPLKAGSGGIFNVQVVSAYDLPMDVRNLLIQSGTQGVSTEPKIDKDAPITAAFLSGPQGTNDWYTGPVEVTLIATDIDGPSDIASTTVSVDGGSTGSFSGPFTVSGDGSHTIEFGSIDLAGNAESPRPSRSFNIDASPPTVSCTATPSMLWPPNGKAISVTVSGSITDSASGPESGSATYKVIDEYGQVQPSGSVVLDGGSYSFGVSLIADRNGSDRDGRKYTIEVNGGDRAGNMGLCSVAIIVPHDQRNN